MTNKPVVHADIDYQTKYERLLGITHGYMQELAAVRAELEVLRLELSERAGAVCSHGYPQTVRCSRCVE